MICSQSHREMAAPLDDEPRSGPLDVNTSGLLWPGGSLRKKFRELGLEHAELVTPRVSHYPEIKPAFRLVVPAFRPQSLKASHLCLNIVSFQFSRGRLTVVQRGA